MSGSVRKLEQFKNINDKLVILFGATYGRKAILSIAKFMADDNSYPIHIILGKERKEFTGHESEILAFLGLNKKDTPQIFIGQDVGDLREVSAPFTIRRLLIFNAERVKELKTVLEDLFKTDSTDQVILLANNHSAGTVINRLIDRFPSLRIVNYTEENLSLKFKAFSGPISLDINIAPKKTKKLGKLVIDRTVKLKPKPDLENSIRLNLPGYKQIKSPGYRVEILENL